MDNRAALEWQWEMGATDFVADTPHDWFTRAAPAAEAAPMVVAPTPVLVSVGMAPPDLSAVGTLGELREAIQNYDGLMIKNTATQLVFGQGVEAPRVMVVGEAPGADEDRIGYPFVGAAGQLLDKMLAAIQLSRETNAYITNILHWRPPGNRTPTPQEIALSLPFLRKHIALMQPEFLLVLGGVAAKGLFNMPEGITRVRGQWYDFTCEDGRVIPAMVTFHPAFLLRTPAQKALAWEDLKALKARLGTP